MILRVILLLLVTTNVVFAGTCGHSGDGAGSTHCTGSTPWTSDTPSYDDVNHCVNTCANSGDTVNVPAGSATWDTKVVITKGMILSGAGIGNTVITNNINGNQDLDDDQLLGYTPASPALDEPFRLTGFTFDGNGYHNLINISNKTRNVITNVRVDNNRFYNCRNKAVYINGEVYGVIDNNEFEDNEWDIAGIGYDEYSWFDLNPPEAGSAEYMYFEDNTIHYSDQFHIDHPGNGVPLSTGQGGNIVFRYNTITNYKAFDILDAHGNQDSGLVIPSCCTDGGADTCCGDGSGTIAIEVYENDIASIKTSGHRLLYHRGGRAIMFNNRVTGTATDANIRMTEEDGCTRFDVDTVYPARQQVHDTYYYNNTLNGVGVSVALTDDSGDAACIADNSNNNAFFIQEDRDYFLQTPIGETIQGVVYSTYTYPHPLQNFKPPLTLSSGPTLTANGTGITLTVQ